MQKTLRKLEKQEPVTVVVAGDSVSVDTHWTFGRKHWIGYLAEALWTHYGDGFITVVNSSKCGLNYPVLEARLDPCVLRFKPDLVMLPLGLSDDPKENLPLEACRASARRVVQRIRDTGGEVLFGTPNPVVFGFWEPRPGGAGMGEAYDQHEKRGYRLARELVQLAHELGCPVVDHYTLWKNHKVPFRHLTAHPQHLWLRMADTVHPNAIGHLALFRDMAPFFKVPRYFVWEEPPAQESP
jgi:lysophospholipase L1-like esterase